MNKTLLASILALIMASSVTFAQTERMPFGHQSSYQLNAKAKSSPIKATAKELVFSADFEEYSTAFDPQVWDVMRSTDTTAVDLASASGSQWFVCTPSNFSGNGYSYIHSGERSAAISYTASNATWLITKDLIAISSQEQSLNFWLYYLHNEAQKITTKFYVMLKEENETDWQSIGKWETDDDTNLFGQIISIEFPKDLVGKNIQIAFVYVNEANENSGFQVAIDDITIGNATDPNLDIKAFNYQYSMVPLALLNTFDYKLRAFVSNQGQDYQGKGATAQVAIEELNGFESLLELDFTIETGESEFIRFNDTPEFSSKGSYNVLYSINQDYSSDDGDDQEGKSDTEKEFNFTVTENILATDYCASAGVAGGFTAGQIAPFGNKYKIDSDIVVSGFEINWPAMTQEHAFVGQIYEVNVVNNTVDLLYENEYFKEANTSDTTIQFNFEPIFITAGAEFFVAVKQISNTPLNIGFDKVSNGQFWRYKNNELELLSNPMIGNIAVRLVLDHPTDTPTLSFMVTNGNEPVENASIQVNGKEPISTDDEGKASIDLANGKYTYTITKDGFATVTNEVTLNYTSISKNITLFPEHKVTFVINELDGDQEVPLQDVEVLMAEKSALTNDFGIAELYVPKGIHNVNILYDEYMPYADLLEIISDTTFTISLEKTTTCHIDFAIAARHLDNGLEDVEVELAGYGTKFTNADGKVLFSGILPSTSGIQYTISKQGYKQVKGTTSPVELDTLTVNDTLDIITFYIRIEVSDKTSPVEDAIVKLGSSELQTDNTGVVLFPSVIPATNISLRISKEGYLSLDTQVSLYSNNLRLSYTIEPEPSSVNVSDEDQFSIYPNPTNGLLTIKGNGTYSIIIMDISGRIVYSKKQNAEQSTIDVSDLHRGVYIVQLSRNNKIFTHRIVKQ